MASEQFCLKWNNFHHNIITAFESLQSTEDLVDVTLSCEGRNVKAHRFILSACSPYFRTLFKSIPNQQHPVIILQNVSHSDLQGVLQFMYQGEVLVTQEGLSTFLKTAELLQVSGLAGSATNRKVNTTQPPESPEVQEIEETILPTTPATDDLISSLSRVKTASPKPPKKQQLDIKLHTEKQEIEPEPIDTIPPQEYQTDLIEPMQSSSSYDPTDSFRVKEETEETHFIEDSMDYSTMSHENTDDSGPAIEEQSILERSLKAQGHSPHTSTKYTMDLSIGSQPEKFPIKKSPLVYVSLDPVALPKRSHTKTSANTTSSSSSTSVKILPKLDGTAKKPKIEPKTDSKDQHGPNFGNCPHCTKVYSNQSALKYHVRLVHSDMLNMFCCHLCPESFEYRESFKAHMWEKHSVRH